MQLRSVCKRWNTLLFSQGFKDLCDQVPRQNDMYFFWCKDGKTDLIRLYDPVERGWKSCSTRFLYHHLFSIHGSSAANEVVAADGRVTRVDDVFHNFVGADGGLLCIQSLKRSWCGRVRDSPLILTVCNPLLRTWRQLPALPDLSFGGTPLYPVCQLVADESTKSYKVIVVAHDLTCNGPTLVYDSVSDSWKTGSNSPQFGYCGHHVICGSVIYVMGAQRHRGASDTYILQKYDMVSGVWSGVPVDMPTNLRWLSLLESHGRILLVGSTGNVVASSIVINSIILWEFKSSTREWLELSRVSDPMLAVFLSERASPRPAFGFPRRRRPWCAVGYGDLILVKRNESQTLAFDLKQGSWDWLPIVRNRVFDGKDGERSLTGFFGSLSLNPV